MHDERHEWQVPKLVLRRPEGTALQTYLLDADDELSELFDVRTRLAARQSTTVRVLEAPPGRCELEPALARVRNGLGLLILDGLLTMETCVGDRTAVELLGQGDLVQQPAHTLDAMLDRTESWRVLWPTRFGVLDPDFCQRVRPWPQLSAALLRRAIRRSEEAAVIRAISCHPRLEVRLDLAFWHLAARWGRVEPRGIRLTLPLTHRLLGELVAAERPSVSHALSRLAHAGLITGTPGDWHLVGSAREHQEALVEPAERLSPRSRW